MLFRRTKWRAAAASGAVGREGPTAARVDNRAVVLWRDGTGRIAAFADLCAHMPLPLSTGRCEGGRLRCRYHGLEYDADGKVVGVYAQAIEDERRAKTYPAAEKYGWVWVWTGDPAEADESAIPSRSRAMLLGLFARRPEGDA